MEGKGKGGWKGQRRERGREAVRVRVRESALEAWGQAHVERVVTWSEGSKGTEEGSEQPQSVRLQCRGTLAQNLHFHRC